MVNRVERWELTILNASFSASRFDSLGAGDIDGDGRMELVVGGDGLCWYRPQTHEHGLISPYYTHVGVLVADIDGDGRLEVACGSADSQLDKTSPMKTPPENQIVWFKPPVDLRENWERYLLDPSYEGHAHDILAVDIDGDGELEIVSIACYTSTPGVFIFKRGADITRPWKKHVVSTEVFAEGLQVGDINGDGRAEIICGPDWYLPPPEGPLSGPWTRHTYAPGFREMCRTALVDVTGSGRPDIVIVESEYLEGRLSWFENRLLEDPQLPWPEHRLLEDLVYGHSLDVRQMEGGGISIMLGEMEKGGWNAPYNHDARVLELSSENGGDDWRESQIDRGNGTHQALRCDIDGDGELEIVGKTWGAYYANPRLQVWHRVEKTSPILCFKHSFVDRDKPYTAAEVMCADVDGDGFTDIVCGAWWYKNPGVRHALWRRYEIPGITQVINLYDIDGDGKQELIALKAPVKRQASFFEELNTELCWLRPRDPIAGEWELYEIGRSLGDWPHGSLVAPLLPDGRLALVVAPHSAESNPAHRPELFEIPAEPGSGKWKKRILADVPHKEEMRALDLTGDGTLDIVAGVYWLENRGDGSFTPYRYAPEGYETGRLGLADINGDGRIDVVLGQEVADWERKHIPMTPLAWFEQPEDPREVPWPMHVIDSVFCAHSIDAYDIDQDGEPEIVCGEHNPFWPYRSRGRLIVYKKADRSGNSWKKYTLDDRFEHHDGAKVFEVRPGNLAIISHGWTDSIYVHLWESDGDDSGFEVEGS
jgi:hypothetical protein